LLGVKIRGFDTFVM